MEMVRDILAQLAVLAIGALTSALFSLAKASARERQLDRKRMEKLEIDLNEAHKAIRCIKNQKKEDCKCKL